MKGKDDSEEEDKNYDTCIRTKTTMETPQRARRGKGRELEMTEQPGH